VRAQTGRRAGWCPGLRWRDEGAALGYDAVGGIGDGHFAENIYEQGVRSHILSPLMYDQCHDKPGGIPVCLAYAQYSKRSWTSQ
jgi:hypothetical protein